MKAKASLLSRVIVHWVLFKSGYKRTHLGWHMTKDCQSKTTKLQDLLRSCPHLVSHSDRIYLVISAKTQKEVAHKVAKPMAG